MGLAAWSGWQAYAVARSLDDAVDHATTLRAALAAPDARGDEDLDASAVAAVELEALRSASDDAAARTSGATWSLLTHLPWIGDDAHGVRTTSRVLDDIARDGLEPLVEVSDRVKEMLPHRGGVDLAAVDDLAEPVAAAQAVFADADATLRAEDDSDFTDRLADRFAEFRGQVAEADRAMTATSTAMSLLPGMLGADGPRTTLLVFQNNAEIRATGGLPGAVMSLHAEDGALSIGRQVAGSSLGRTSEPVLPLTPAERDQYGDILGTYFVDANMTPDVPRAADLMRARWEAAFPDERLDAVLLIDTVTLGYVLQENGPVTVDGVTLTGDNVVDELLHGTYLRLPDPADQDDFFADVAAKAFAHFVDGAGDGPGTVRALARAVAERRAFVHSFHDEEQAALAGSPVAGELVADPDVAAPQVTVTMNDTTGAKMSYFLRYDVDVRATYCTDGVQGFSAKARLWSAAPADAADLPAYVTGANGRGYVDAGSQLVTVRVMGPAGGRIKGMTVASKPTEARRTHQAGRPVAELYVLLEPGQKVDLAWTMRGGPGQDGDAALWVTPSVEQGSDAGTVAAVCR
ncbi:DUF4012 domain-containing protein [Nocardioides sp. GY 10113]|nr:DUF4012 domain-containing protein [Nocardioides sp. GY 10113]